MNRNEFIKQLEYLLQNIPQQDREDALNYYQDYFEEAGSENEEHVLEEFGSPERVAAIIRSDLSGSLESGGSFTDQGYEDERFKDPNYQIAHRYDLPMEIEVEAITDEPMKDVTKKTRSPLAKLLIAILLLIAIIPIGSILIAVGTVAIAGITTIVAGGIALITLTFVFGLASIVLLISAIASMWLSPTIGIGLLGVFCLFVVLTMICFMLLIAIYGMFIPFCAKKLIMIIRNVLHRRRNVG